ncbi:MAG: hypothetical protein AAGA54_20145 [Myxococcota bacterium]
MTRRSNMNRALVLAASLRRRGKRGAPQTPSNAPKAEIEGIAFAGATIRSGGVAVAKIRGRNLNAADVRCEAMSKGFILDVLPDYTVQSEGEELVLAMRVFRRIGTPRALCLVRVTIGSTSAVGSITVRV